jgi:hypothetical protein
VLDEQSELGLTGGLEWLGGRLGLRGALDNLLDRHSVDLVGYPLPGRSGNVELEAWW